MSGNGRIDQLSDQTVLRILSELTQDIREELPAEQATVVRSEAEAREALAVLFATYTGEISVASDALVSNELEAVRLGRELLKLLLDDEIICPRVEELIAEPPQDRQMSVELAIASAVVLGALISWLQTKVHLHVTSALDKLPCSPWWAARPLDPQEQQALYRAAQEGLTNARKHAQAASATLTLDFGAANRVRLTVADNGRGASATDGGFGLIGLRERVQLVGGSLALQTAPGAGLMLIVEVPG